MVVVGDVDMPLCEVRLKTFLVFSVINDYFPYLFNMEDYSHDSATKDHPIYEPGLKTVSKNVFSF